tara:strand:+ start:435 stop:662 length:228 start_codon:yes stop_codon:yes gene_type:complete
MKPLTLEDFESVDGNYENCPVDCDLMVWTGDSFTTEYVTMESEHGTYYPANGVEFTHYVVLPCTDKAQYYLGEGV